MSVSKMIALHPDVAGNVNEPLALAVRHAYRAFGYEAPGHKWRDAKLALRSWRMGLGIPPAGSSPEAQQEQGLSRDPALAPKRSEGEKLRNGAE